MSINTQVTPVRPEITIQNDQATTTSKEVAKIFSKAHKNVIRDIESLECSPEFVRLNFEPIFYADGYGRQQSAYSITRDGFAFLAMGFTGKKAAQFKEAYINAFNEAEKRLQAPDVANEKKLNLANQFIKSLDIEGRPVLVPLMELSELIHQTRQIQNEMTVASQKIDLYIDHFKDYWGANLMDEGKKKPLDFSRE